MTSSDHLAMGVTLRGLLQAEVDGPDYSGPPASTQTTRLCLRPGAAAQPGMQGTGSLPPGYPPGPAAAIQVLGNAQHHG